MAATTSSISSSAAAAISILRRLLLLRSAVQQPPFSISSYRSIQSAATATARAILSERHFRLNPNSVNFSSARSFSSLPQSAISNSPVTEEVEEGKAEVEEDGAEESGDGRFSCEIEPASGVEERGGGQVVSGELEEAGVDSGEVTKGDGEGTKVLDLSVREKKELSSIAHGLGKKLKCQWVGKSGVTENLVASYVDTLEAHEFLKIKIHKTCPGDLEVVVQQLEKLTCSAVVGRIGRTVIVYRPSITKKKKAEKRKEESDQVKD